MIFRSYESSTDRYTEKSSMSLTSILMYKKVSVACTRLLIKESLRVKSLLM